jgi:hypothetical protein
MQINFNYDEETDVNHLLAMYPLHLQGDTGHFLLTESNYFGMVMSLNISCKQ